MDASNDNAMLKPSAWERLEGAIEKAKERVPTLSTGLLLAAFVLGAVAGGTLSKYVHRLQINKEWRERIASQSAAVRGILAKGELDADALDDALVKSLGDTDEKLRLAERQLSDAGTRPGDAGACRIPAWRLR